MAEDALTGQFLLINKPVGWTSFDVVNYIRKHIRYYGSTDGTEQRTPIAIRSSGLSVVPYIKNIKVGHAGTLDPFAAGLLIVGVGREATKRLDEFKRLPKTYVATIRLGAVSDTYDVTGTIKPYPFPPPTRGRTQEGVVPRTLEEVQTILASFLGKQMQTPPMFSAKKVGGQRLYKLARQGKEVEREPVEIEMYDIRLLDYEWPRLKTEVTCSAGTYIRSLAHDIGEKLGVGAYCEELVRTKIGDYTLEKAHDITDIEKIFYY